MTIHCSRPSYRAHVFICFKVCGIFLC